MKRSVSGDEWIECSPLFGYSCYSNTLNPSERGDAAKMGEEGRTGHTQSNHHMRNEHRVEMNRRRGLLVFPPLSTSRKRYHQSPLERDGRRREPNSDQYHPYIPISKVVRRNDGEAIAPQPEKR